MVTASQRVLFLGKNGDRYCAGARAWCERNFDEVTYFEGGWGEALPSGVLEWQGDLIVSYQSRWIVPQCVLDAATRAAVNFHPGTPEYPGIGCNNFALYEEAPTYGATCHHMAVTVDAGPIIDVIRFPMNASTTVDALLKQTYMAMYELFERVMTRYVHTGEFSASAERWTRKPFSRKQFDELCRIRPEMSAQEVAKRVRATDYLPYGPHVELHGYTFKLVRGAH